MLSRIVVTPVVALVGLFASAVAIAQTVALNPSEIVVRRVDASVSAQLTANGVPLAPDQVESVKLYVDKHDYDEMFSVAKTPGTLTFTPTIEVEIGVYELVVVTEAGTAYGTMRVTLEEDPALLENRARAQGITVDEMRRRLGLVNAAGREMLDIELAPAYYTGQALDIAMSPQETREYQWIVNGNPAASGRGPHRFHYVFKAPGEYAIVYREFQRNETIAETKSSTTVIDEPVVPWEVKSRARLFLPGPADFTHYEWRVNGETISRQATLRHSFQEPGNYSLECIASSTEPQERYRKITYNVTVK